MHRLPIACVSYMLKFLDIKNHLSCLCVSRLFNSICLRPASRPATFCVRNPGLHALNDLHTKIHAMAPTSLVYAPPPSYRFVNISSNDIQTIGRFVSVRHLTLRGNMADSRHSYLAYTGAHGYDDTEAPPGACIVALIGPRLCERLVSLTIESTAYECFAYWNPRPPHVHALHFKCLVKLDVTALSWLDITQLPPTLVDLACANVSCGANKTMQNMPLESETDADADADANADADHPTLRRRITFTTRVTSRADMLAHMWDGLGRLRLRHLAIGNIHLPPRHSDGPIIHRVDLADFFQLNNNALESLDLIHLAIHIAPESVIHMQNLRRVACRLHSLASLELLVRLPRLESLRYNGFHLPTADNIELRYRHTLSFDSGAMPGAMPGAMSGAMSSAMSSAMSGATHDMAAPNTKTKKPKFFKHSSNMHAHALASLPHLHTLDLTRAGPIDLSDLRALCGSRAPIASLTMIGARDLDLYPLELLSDTLVSLDYDVSNDMFLMGPVFHAITVPHLPHLRSMVSRRCNVLCDLSPKAIPNCTMLRTAWCDMTNLVRLPRLHELDLSPPLCFTHPPFDSAVLCQFMLTHPTFQRLRLPTSMRPSPELTESARLCNVVLS